jgi:hypothetical protein
MFGSNPCFTIVGNGIFSFKTCHPKLWVASLAPKPAFPNYGRRVWLQTLPPQTMGGIFSSKPCHPKLWAASLAPKPPPIVWGGHL